MKSEGISRRGFIKRAAAGAVGVAAIGVLSGCAETATETAAAVVDPTATTVPVVTEAATVEATAVATEAVAAPVATGDGKYLTKALGHEDFIYVSTTLRDGAIAACSVVSHKETMGIGNYACARIPAAILANQSIKVPNIRGCSTSSMAIKKAVEEALTLAGYDVAKFSAEVAEPDNATAETKDVDVVVVGAGTAGLVAAAKLLDAGYSVAVIEKRAIPGGSMPMTWSGISVAETPTLANYNVDGTTVPEYYSSMDSWIGLLSQSNNPDFDKYNATSPFQRQSYTSLGEATEWFKTIGIGFCSLGAYEGGYQYASTSFLAPGCYMGGAGYAMMALASRIERHPKGEILYMTKLTELVQDPTTKQVTGVKAVGLKSDDSENGYQLTVNAKAVILATGGFAKNADMVTEYYPEKSGCFFNCASASTGEGIQMGLAAGSKMECTGRELGAFLSTTTFFELAFMHYSTPGIMVNASGNNIGNITSGNHKLLGSALLDEANGGAFYYVFDETSVPSTKDFEMYNFTTYEALWNRGEVKYYPTVDEAAADLELAGLAAAIDANNTASLAGEADEFGRKNCPFIDTRNGVYILPVMPTFYLTTGGLCIDPAGHVLTDSYIMDGQNTTIPGLYACGDVCGSVEEKDGKAYGMGFDMGMGMGYAVAKTIEADGVTKAA